MLLYCCIEWKIHILHVLIQCIYNHCHVYTICMIYIQHMWFTMWRDWHEIRNNESSDYEELFEEFTIGSITISDINTGDQTHSETQDEAYTYLKVKCSISENVQEDVSRKRRFCRFSSKKHSQEPTYNPYCLQWNKDTTIWANITPVPI